MEKSLFVFTHHGVPVFPVGLQSHNSSACSADELCLAFRAVEICHCNSLAVPVYWEQVEPREGKYEFEYLEGILRTARESHIYLFLVWFGTWKNGCMKYVPSWIKSDPQKYWRVIAGDGTPLPVLSPSCENTRKADQRAFGKLMEYLRKADEKENTVLAVQVENEAGIMGAVRDFSSQSEKEFQASVPLDLYEKMKKYPDSPVSRCWSENGGEFGNWNAVFGNFAAEYFNAYKTACYMDSIAYAGKQKYSLPIYMNVQVDQYKWRIPGYNYPSGGAVEKTLDLWKWYAPNIDLIAPDIYLWDSRAYEKCCQTYARADNPLFIPESGPNESASRYLFEAVGRYGAIGYFLFGAEGILLQSGELDPVFSHIVGSLRSLSAIAPVWHKYRGNVLTGVVNQMEYMAVQRIDFTDYIALISFIAEQPEAGGTDSDWNWQDHRHREYRQNIREEKRRGRGLIIQVEKQKFLALGDAYRVVFVPRCLLGENLPSIVSSEYLLCRSAEYLSVEEGYFDNDGIFQCTKKRNGDESDFGIWVQPDIGVVKVRLG